MAIKIKNKQSNIDLYEKFFQMKILEINNTTKFWWSSGILSPIYTDNRLILNYPEFRDLIENRLANYIKNNYSDTTKIVGVASAGIGHGAIIAHILKLPFAYGRATVKEHGKKNMIEGQLEKGDKVVLIEDLISTGKSVGNIAREIKNKGIKVSCILSIFSYELPSSVNLFKLLGIPNYYLIGIKDIIKYGEKANYISKEEANSVKKFITTLKK